MAVRVKIKKPKKARAPALKVSDWAHPSDLKEKKAALIAGLGMPTGFLLLLLILPGRDFLFPLWLAWLAAAFAVHMWLWPSRQKRALRKDETRSAEDAAFARVLQMSLGRVSSVLSVPRGVSAVLTSKGIMPLTFGRTIVVPASLRAKLSEPEVMVLLAREVGHIAGGHVTLSSLLRSMSISPRLLQVVGLPLGVLVMLLHRWSYYADVSADRFAALACGDGKAVAQSILRIALHAEPEGEHVSAEEVAEHLAAPEGLKAQEQQITTHFRLGEYLKERPDVYARLKAVASYVGSSEHKAAVEKLRAAQSPAQPA
jgi:Zn-dependent protease with chaperone function